jgi:hypothetical protein
MSDWWTRCWKCGWYGCRVHGPKPEGSAAEGGR